ncbi:DUF1709-domain-containing protein [Polychaeton citri CBS 116435]|uniref:DUF1709-domain-containing protein n=1 Tax=Polychaeton citri CBS 116435 TaxID=1314669 RepID=A0A9P4QAR3_9PEZI|nr:DUF1709-domain-containing protein [Polychaeton citri CBS 116435]
MASDPAVKPLRISKNNSNASPEKAQPRALAELGAGNQRRNSPSYNQATRKMIVSKESSPFTGDENSSFLSPTSATEKKSPRNFWSQFDRENNMPTSRVESDSSLISRSPSPGVSPRRRPSVERLLNAGRVRGSNIFALESKDKYDPTAVPIIERPSANRPLSEQLANNSFHRYDSLRKENNPIQDLASYSPTKSPATGRFQSESDVPSMSPSKEASSVPLPPSPEKSERTSSRDSPSPTKSSLARMSMFDRYALQFDPENGTWSDEDDEGGAQTPRARSLHRQNKSVTFGPEPASMYEYEEQTPEPSVEASSREGSWDTEELEEMEYSFERGSSAEVDRDDSFDADLENADKTPVVLPEQWSRMSPDAARTDLVDDGDDVFEGSPEPAQRPAMARSESITSNGSNRPLPAIPGEDANLRNSSALAVVAERAARLSLGLPKPAKRASCSKDEIMRLKKQSSMMLRDQVEREREQEYSFNEDSHGSVNELQEELVVRNLDTGEKIDISVHEQEEAGDDSILRDLDSFTAPRISRESILKKVRNTKYDFEDPSDEEVDQSEIDGMNGRPSYAELAKYHPDAPIPSRENSRENSDSYMHKQHESNFEETSEVEIKAEPVDDDSVDMANIPLAPRSNDVDDFETSVLVHRKDQEHDDDSDSKYSSAEPEQEPSVLQEHQPSPPQEEGKESLDQAMGLLSVRDYAEQICKPAPKSVAQQESAKSVGSFMGLPQYLSTDDYDFGMREYITPSPPLSNTRDVKDPLENIQPTPHQSVIENEEPSQLEPPLAPFAQDYQDNSRGSLDSVIHRPSSGYVDNDDDEPISPVDERQLSPERKDEPVSPVLEFEAHLPEPPEIPERRSTIKTSGKLKTRPSASRADLEELRAQMEEEDAQAEPVPHLPEQHNHRQVHDGEAASTHSTESKNDSIMGASKSAKPMNLNLSIPAFDNNSGNDGGFGDLDAEFDRVIENQKKGYLMRQSTKVVVASSRNFSNDTAKSTESSTAPMSPNSGTPRPLSRGGSGRTSARKPSAEQWMKTEPWNGKARRKSQRNASAQKAFESSVAPPLPGKESALVSVDENYATQATGSLDGEVADGVERGRLFVKVVKVKELDLPLPRNDRLYFQLTLDNGLHCVTTSNLELGKTANIGQEFELVVLNDLEFQLTLTTKLPPPRKWPEEELPRPQWSPQKPKQGALSKLLSTPRRRAERERQEREAFEAEERRYQEQLRRKRASVQPTAWDTLHELVNGADGSFARSYVNLAAHENECFGRQLTVDVPCYNEWALEQDQAVVSSVRSKGRGRGGEVRKPPYVIGKLEVQLMYVPKPKGVDEDAMPKSMNSAVREISKASERVEITHEGHLSQQGGDCVHWRRRFFRLQGAKLTAYHENTHQKRAVINLSKAARLVDDRSTLVGDPAATSQGKGRRRKSAFAEEDEGYQYVEEGFRIRFANGEAIDFYADSAAQKEGWMAALAQMVGKPDLGSKKASWTDVVLARERAMGKLSPLTPTLDGSSSPVKISPSDSAMAQNEIQTHDFTKPPAQQANAQLPMSPRSKASIERKPVTGLRNTAQSSPVKGPPTYRAPDPPKADSAKERPKSMIRPGTPPLEARRGHRSRDAVKSMIF